MGRFGKNHETKDERAAKREPLPDDFWCVECDGTGFIPATIVSRKGRVNEMSVACWCEAGLRYAPRTMMLYQQAVRVGVLDESANTKSKHWLHAKLRLFELTEDVERLTELRAIIASGNAAEYLKKKWETEPPQGPLAGNTRGVVR